LTEQGRNERCNCGSGKRYKHCHGLIYFDFPTFDIYPIGSQKNNSLFQQRLAALEKNRRSQQGLGKPILTANVNDQKLVAIGNRGLASRGWRTMHDFLPCYLEDVIGTEWFIEERKKLGQDRHPLIQWSDKMEKYRLSLQPKGGGAVRAPMIGAVEACLQLAYNLYIVEHNKDIQQRMIARLKHKDQFQGAFYEISVLASLVKAGFTVEYEDESGASGKRCECIATDRRSGRKYTVEAKSIHRIGLFGVVSNGRSAIKLKQDISDQLRGALKKESDYPRIIFIELNSPKDGELGLIELEKGGDIVRAKDKDLPNADPAFVFITNHSHQYHLDTSPSRAVVAVGFKLPNFGNGVSWKSLRDYHMAKQKYSDIERLMCSMIDHYNLPVTFDGDIPELTLIKPKNARLIVGERYKVPDQMGKEVDGVLESGIVLEENKSAMCTFFVEDGQRRYHIDIPLSDEELLAYQRYPDTFFGVINDVPKKLVDRDYLSLFDFFMTSCAKLSKDELLNHAKDSPHYNHFIEMDKDELSVTYCEGLVASIIEKDKEAMKSKNAINCDLEKELKKS
jgi:hypothetical protein